MLRKYKSKEAGAERKEFMSGKDKIDGYASSIDRIASRLFFKLYPGRFFAHGV